MAFGSAGDAGAGGAPAPAPRPRPPAAPRPPPPPPPKLRFQTPEKSTLPSTVRGAGPSRRGLPSAVRGTPGVGYDGHCAAISDDTAMTPAATMATRAPQLLTPDLPLLISTSVQVSRNSSRIARDVRRAPCNVELYMATESLIDWDDPERNAHILD